MAGATPGLHFPESRFYIRRVRLSSTSELISPLKEAGYPICGAVNDDKKQTVVVEIPVDVGNNVRTLETVSMWEQLQLAAFVQAFWADNQVEIQLHSILSGSTPPLIGELYRHVRPQDRRSSALLCLGSISVSVKRSLLSSSPGVWGLSSNAIRSHL